MQPELCIVIVNWNVSGLLRNCLHSIYASNISQGTQVIVVDNASSDDSVGMVRMDFPKVMLICNTSNLGFTKANNQALVECDTRYTMLLNPDTVVQPNAIQRMLDYMQAHPDVGIVGPRLVYGNGSPQPSRRRFPTLGMALAESTPWEWHFPHNPQARAYHLSDQPDDITQDVDWVTGACMLVRREVLDQVGLLDERFFMYSEELDWCRRITRAGWRVVFLPEAVVMHLEGASSGQVVAARHIRFNSSKVYYFKKHHGRLQAAILQTAILAMFALEWAGETAKWLVGYKRSMRRERMRAYAQVIRSGLRLQVQV